MVYDPEARVLEKSSASRAARLTLCLSIAAFTLESPGLAEAAELSLRSRTVYHGWQLRLPDRTRLRNMNRFYSTLDIGGWGAWDGQIDAVVSMRYDTEFATGLPRDNPAPRFVGADGRNDLDLMYAYVDWRVLPERLSLRLGRQLILDDLDWYSLDGLKITTHLTRDAFFEVYGGFAVPYGTFMSSDAFANDGLEVSDGPKLAVGGAVFWRVNGDLTLSAAYRQEHIVRKDDLEVFTGYAPGSEEYTLIQQLSGGRVGFQEHLVGASASYIIRPIDLEAYARLTYNLLFLDLDQTRAGLNWDPARALHLGLEYMRVRPRFAADSIFNVFNIFPYDRGRLEAELEILPGLRAHAGYFLQKMNGGPVGLEDGPEFPRSDLAHGPRGGLTYRPSWLGLGAFAEANMNYGGDFAFGGNYRRFELFGDLTLLERALYGWLRLNYTGFQNDWFEGRDAGQVPDEKRSFMIDLGAQYTFLEFFTARLNYVQNIGSYLEGTYRILSSLEVRYN